MNFKIIENKKNSLEIEFDDKGLPNMLLMALNENGVDAYTYEPHPLLQGYMLHIDAENPAKEFKKAVADVSKKWGELEKLIESKIKK